MNKIALSIAALFLMVALFLFLNPPKDGSPEYSPELNPTDKDCPAAMEEFFRVREKISTLPTPAEIREFRQSIGCPVDAPLPRDILFEPGWEKGLDPELKGITLSEPEPPPIWSNLNPERSILDHDAAPPLPAKTETAIKIDLGQTNPSLPILDISRIEIPSHDFTVSIGGDTSYYLMYFETSMWTLGLKLDGTVDVTGVVPNDMYTQFWELLAGAFPEWREKACK